MGDIVKSQICQEIGLKKSDKSHLEQLQWGFMKAKDDAMDSDLDDSLESSSSSTEMIEDASSSSSSSSSCSPLFELSDLMAHLPIKRGLSKFYQGKSESFATLTSVKSVEDLAKKDKYCSRSKGSMKRLSPKATIAKNKKGSPSTTNKSSMFSSLGNMSSLMAT